MLKRFKNRNLKPKDLGVDLNPGDDHYRAFVGPPRDYDLVSAMVFNLLTCIGLRQHHRVLDIGCGSLRIGRLLIPYLNTGCYFGVEPNKWLVKDGIQNEVGKDLIRLKKPTFSYDSSLEKFKGPLGIDFAVAQSIFSHCGTDLISRWLEEVSKHLSDTGALVATFLRGEEDYTGAGWVYPPCVKYCPDTISKLADKCDLNFEILDWAHRSQTWALFSKEKFDKSLIVDGPISWNRFMEKELRK